ncbi:CBS domain-containing protein, partial [Paenibacillus lignilyticus]
KGARVALKVMKDNGISTVYIVDKQKRLIGAVTAADARDAVEKNLTLAEVLNKDVTTVQQDTLLIDLFDDVSMATIPVAVIDQDKRLKGIVIRGAVIGALAGNETYINDIEYKELPAQVEREVL